MIYFDPKLNPTGICRTNKTVGVYLNGATLYKHLDDNYDRIDVMTYTFTYPQVYNIDRVICGKRIRKEDYDEEIRFKILANVHIKMLIAYKKGIWRKHETYDVFVGSLNQVNASLIDLMVKVGPLQAVYLKKFYEKVWKFKPNVKPQ